MSRGGRRPIVFYDANCFANIPFEELKSIVKEAENKILSTTLDELRVGWQKYRNDPRFELVFRKDGKLKGYFQEISLKAVRKNLNICFDNKSPIYLKENPIVCSAYYTWLPSAVNPATITDVYRHVFNHLLFQLRIGENIPNDWYRIEQQFRKEEVNMMREVNTILGHLDGLDPAWILESRNKRIKEVQQGNLKLADYQLVVSAFLYACINGCNAFVLSCDRDLLDIHENLMRSIIEYYTIYSLLSRKIRTLDNHDRLVYYYKGIKLFISRDEIIEELSNVGRKICNSSPVIRYGILYCKPDTGMVHRNINLIPIWLRDFSLEYKTNLDCFSLDPRTEMKYPIKFIMDPTKARRYVLFYVFPRARVFYPGFIPECERQCKYALAEKQDPSKITDFLKDPDILNGPVLFT